MLIIHNKVNKRINSEFNSVHKLNARKLNSFYNNKMEEP